MSKALVAGCRQLSPGGEYCSLGGFCGLDAAVEVTARLSELPYPMYLAAGFKVWTLDKRAGVLLLEACLEYLYGGSLKVKYSPFC